MSSEIKILIAEHDAADIEMIRNELQQGGVNFVSEAVQTEQDYVNALKTFVPDIIFSDYAFPSFSGVLAFEIRQKMAPAIPFILLSGTIGEENSIELIKNGVTDFVLKDKMFTLNTKLNRALKEANERKLKHKADLELLQSEKQYRQIVETAQEGIWLIDENNFTTLVNKKMADMLGYSSGEMIGKQNYFFMDEEWKERATGHIAKRKLGINESHEFKYISKSGGEVWASLSTNAVFDEAGVYKGALAMVTDITERRAVAARVKESEERYHTLFEQNLAGIYQSTLDGVIVDCNDAFMKMLKYDCLEELVGIDALELYFSHSDREKFIAELRQQRKLSNYEIILKCKDGSRLHVLENISLRKDEITGEEFCEGIMLDITKRKRAEQEIGWLVNNTEESFILLNRKLEITSFNDRAQQLYAKYLLKDLIKGSSILNYAQPDRQSLVEDIYEKVLSGSEETSEIIIPLPGGLEKTFLLKYKPAKDENEAVIGVFVSAIDITDKKKAEDKIKESELRYRSLNEQATDAICITDASMKFININPYGCETFGYTEQEALQLSLPDILFMEDLVDNPLKVNELALGKITRNERRLKRKDGTAIAMEVSTKIMQDGSLIMFGHDITERKKAEEKVQKANRLYNFISQVSQRIVHVQDEASLFRNACQVAFEFGKFRMAWIGLFDNGTKTITLTEQRGIPDAEISRFMQFPYQPHGSQAQVLKNGLYYTRNDNEDEPGLQDWKPFAKKYGLRSMIALPVKKAGNVIASFNLYSHELNFFDKEEIALLIEVTNDISFALDLFEQAKKQKETEKLMLERETRFRVLIEKSSDMETLSTLEGQMIYGSPAITKVLGYSPEEFCQRSAFDLIHPDDIPGFREKRAEIINVPGRSFYNQNRFLHKNGNWVWCDGIVTNMFHEPGVNALVSNFRDISERKRAEQQTEFDSINLDALINNTTDLMWSVDKDLKLINFNQPFFEIINLHSGKSLVKGDDVLSVVLSDEQLRRFRISYGRALAGETFTEIEHIAAPVDSWSEISYYPIRKGTEIIGIACHSRDITERKRNEVAVIVTLKEKNIILESIADAFFAVDKSFTVTYWNSQAEKMLRKTRSEIVGNNLWKIFTDSLDSLSYKKYSQAIETNEVVHFEDYYAALEKWYEISAYPSSSGLSVYFKDVSERKLSDMKLNELNIHLQKNAKELAVSNAELEQFAYVASHDLQEPLRMVTSFLVLLEKKYANVLDDKGRRYINFAVDGAKRMRQIILDLLEFSRVGGIDDKLEDVDLDSLVEEIQVLFKKQTDEQGAFIHSEKLPEITAFKTPLRQVFQNLVSNGLKYRRKDTPPQINITATEQKDQWLFTISDNGIGIQEEYFDKIFVIFQRLHNKDEFSGTGMGLAITKKIIEGLGGKIWLTSEEGRGSTFYFTILKQYDEILG